MSPVRQQGVPGATRKCPHCRQTILESAKICPACRHHLKFAPGEKAPPAPTVSPLRVEGTIKHPDPAEPWEYSILVSVLDDDGAEIARHVAGVGVLRASERRSFAVAVEVSVPDPMATAQAPRAASPSARGKRRGS
jgi:hypothetical protein